MQTGDPQSFQNHHCPNYDLVFWKAKFAYRCLMYVCTRLLPIVATCLIFQAGVTKSSLWIQSSIMIFWVQFYFDYYTCSTIRADLFVSLWRKERKPSIQFSIYTYSLQRGCALCISSVISLTGIFISLLLNVTTHIIWLHACCFVMQTTPHIIIFYVYPLWEYTKPTSTRGHWWTCQAFVDMDSTIPGVVFTV